MKQNINFEECKNIKKDLLEVMKNGSEYSIHDLSYLTGISEIKLLKTLNTLDRIFHIHIIPLNGIIDDSVSYFI